MSNVVELSDFRPHIGGEALCLQCKHTWAYVAPAGTTALECPECGTFKGVPFGLVKPDIVWVCECGCDLFLISPNGSSCSFCGLDQQGF